MKNISFRLAIDDDLDRRLRKVATHWGSMSHLVREGIRIVVQREEERQRIMDVLQNTRPIETEAETVSEGNCDCKKPGTRR